jgi:hypothetical protein
MHRSVRTSQKTHYVSATEINRLMLFRETVAVYCENHTEHTDTVRTSQESPYVSATETNRLMLFGEADAVYCENHTEHTDTLYVRLCVCVCGWGGGGVAELFFVLRQILTYFPIF